MLVVLLYYMGNLSNFQPEIPISENLHCAFWGTIYYACTSIDTVKFFFSIFNNSFLSNC